MRKIVVLILILSFFLCGCSGPLTETDKQMSDTVNPNETIRIEKSALDDISRTLYLSDVRALLSCGFFDTPQDIDLDKLLLAAALRRTEYPDNNSRQYEDVYLTGYRYMEEIARLRMAGYDLPFDELKSKKKTSYVRIPYDYIDSRLKKYMGISVKDLETQSEIIYLDNPKVFYCNMKDANKIPKTELERISIDMCEITGDTAKVYYKDKILTAQKVDGCWLIRSLALNPDGYYTQPGRYSEESIYGNTVRNISFEEAQEINKVMYFQRGDGCPEERLIFEALRLDEGFRYKPGDKRKSVIRNLTRAMAYEMFGEKYMDDENPYLTAEDAEEIAYLKEQGVKIDFGAIENGTIQYARIPYSKVDSLLLRYLGTSLREIKDSNYDNKYGAFYERITNYNLARFCCYDGFYTERCLRLIGDGSILTFFKTDDGYKFLSVIHTDTYYSSYMDSENENIDIYERNGQNIFDYTVKARNKYLHTSPTQSERYNNAVAAFNRYLKGREKEQYDYEINNTPWYGTINAYGLYDMTGDGVPELLLDMGYGPMDGGREMYMYVNGEVKNIDVPSWAAQHGPSHIMANGMIGVEHHGAGVYYTFYKYGSDGSITKIKFAITGPDDFYFNDEKVTEKEYDKLTEYYLTEFDKVADIEWTPYFESIVYY